jgi:ribosomal protein L10
MSEDTDTPRDGTSTNEVLKAELKSLRRELASGFERIEHAMSQNTVAHIALEARVRELELARATEEGGQRKAKELLVIATGAAGLLGSLVTAALQWLFNGGKGQ